MKVREIRRHIETREISVLNVVEMIHAVFWSKEAVE